VRGRKGTGGEVREGECCGVQKILKIDPGKVHSLVLGDMMLFAFVCLRRRLSPPKLLKYSTGTENQFEFD